MCHASLRATSATICNSVVTATTERDQAADRPCGRACLRQPGGGFGRFAGQGGHRGPLIRNTDYYASCTLPPGLASAVAVEQLGVASCLGGPARVLSASLVRLPPHPARLACLGVARGHTLGGLLPGLLATARRLPTGSVALLGHSHHPRAPRVDFTTGGAGSATPDGGTALRRILRQAARAFVSIPREDSMITRHGRSASTVSSVFPNSDIPALRGGRDITTARARISLASSTIRRPACPGRTFSQWPVTRRPPLIRAVSMIVAARASSSGVWASIGALGGTVIVTSTWMPRRRRAARRTAVETASGE